MVKWGKICKEWGPKFWESIFNLFNFQIPLKRHIFRFLSLPYQWVSGLILIKCSHFGPVVLFEQSQSWLIELILGRYNSEEVREASCREHWMSVRVSYLIIIIIKDLISIISFLAFSSQFISTIWRTNFGGFLQKPFWCNSKSVNN